MIFVLDILPIVCRHKVINSAEMMVNNAKCYIPSFKTTGPLEKNIFKIFTIYGHGGHLDHVTWTKYINFL